MIKDFLEANCIAVINDLEYAASRLDMLHGLIRFQAVVPFPEGLFLIPRKDILHISKDGTKETIALEKVRRVTVHITEDKECFIDVESAGLEQKRKRRLKGRYFYEA